jgi:hypothetical protein
VLRNLRRLECNPAQVLKHLPANGVVVELIGSFSLAEFSDPVPPDDPGTLRAPDALCRGWGGYAGFTASRAFGPAKDPHVLQLNGCLGQAVAQSAAVDLRKLMASATDPSLAVH